ncbi:transmembrane anterior posterior transformation protein 1 homolog isoform X1 [Halichondria panicea]|uniref:transmembrane anterior posterior transformation protein 1 homolog isoform X1 n=1 Tax=Halichondria panicea TaxID=6063 RepID=UPI00312B8585
MGISLYNYVRCELTRGHGLKDGQGLFSEKQRRVTRFMKTPRELEKLMLFGFLIMMDTFLFVFTWLPLRALLSLTVYTAILSCCSKWTPLHSTISSRDSLSSSCMSSST